jgi:hypothetical protein
MIEGLFNKDTLTDLVVTNGDSNTVVTFLGMEQPFPDAAVEVRSEEGRSVGSVRYWDAMGNLDPNLDRTSDLGRFIVFNLPPGTVSVRATQKATGNRLVTIYPDSVSDARVLVKEIAPEFVTVEGQVGDVTGRPRPGVLLSFLGTGTNNVSPNFTGAYTTFLPANTETIVKITPKGSAGGVADLDGDGVPDNVDNCPNIPNADQVDSDGNGTGDICDPASQDFDGDNVPDAIDNCPGAFNPDQLDADEDGIGNACDVTDALPF